MGQIDPGCTGWHVTNKLMERVMTTQSERDTEIDKQTVSVRQSHMHIPNKMAYVYIVGVGATMDCLNTGVVVLVPTDTKI